VKGTTKRGTADIHAVIGGRHVSIEVKAGRDRMSDAQHKTKAAIESCGGVYYIACDFASFTEWYSHFINNQPNNHEC
jgi:Holliday junction resolvase